MLHLIRLGYLGVATGILITIFIEFGNQHRDSFKSQFSTYFDGLEWQRVPDGYPESRNHELDKFEQSYYEQVRSVAQAVKFISENYEISDQASTVAAVQDFVSKRFIHHTPRHTFLTNPYYWLLEKISPQYAANKVYLADDLLRHFAIAECANAANAFVEIYRAMGFRAQFIDLVGHQLAEAEVNGEKWIVDPDLEIHAPYSVKQIQKNPELIRLAYANRDSAYHEILMKIFSRPKAYSGYDGAPSNDPYLYQMQQRVSLFKRWLGPGIIIFSIVLIMIVRIFFKS